MSPEQYRAKADEAEKLADDPALDPQARRDYLDMAASWRSCADQAAFVQRVSDAAGGDEE